MGKKSLGAKMDRALEDSGKEGVCFSDALSGCCLNWDQVRETISRWDNCGKITCIKKREPLNHGLYVSTKYVSEGIR